MEPTRFSDSIHCEFGFIRLQVVVSDDARARIGSRNSATTCPSLRSESSNSAPGGVEYGLYARTHWQNEHQYHSPGAASLFTPHRPASNDEIWRVRGLLCPMSQLERSIPIVGGKGSTVVEPSPRHSSKLSFSVV